MNFNNVFEVDGINIITQSIINIFDEFWKMLQNIHLSALLMLIFTGILFKNTQKWMLFQLSFHIKRYLMLGFMKF